MNENWTETCCYTLRGCLVAQYPGKKILYIKKFVITVFFP